MSPPPHRSVFESEHMEALLGSHKVAAVARALHSLSQLNPTNRDAIIDAIDDLRELATALDLDARVR